MNKIIQLFKINENFSNRVFGLDLLRFFAIFFVLHNHALGFFPRQFVGFYKFFIYDGVGIFFVLSGFLIGGIFIKMLEKYKLNLKFIIQFWIRRWFRTLPNYYLFLIILLVYNAFLTEGFFISDYFHYFFFLQNIFDKPEGFFGESWSLSVEEWFYFLLPIFTILLSLLLKNKKIILIIFIISILIVCNCYRYYAFLSGASYNVFSFSVLAKLDCILYGVLGAFFSFYYKDYWRKYKNCFLVLGITLLLLDKASVFFKSPLFNSTITSLTILFMLPYFSLLILVKHNILTSLITYVSLVSYSIYLVNKRIVDFINYFLNVDRSVDFFNNQLGVYLGVRTIVLLFNFSLFFVLTFLISILIYKFYETKITKFRDNKFFKRQLDLDIRTPSSL